MGRKYGNYHLQYLFDDLHVIYMFFTYYVNFQLFQCWAILEIHLYCNATPTEILISTKQLQSQGMDSAHNQRGANIKTGEFIS